MGDNKLEETFGSSMLPGNRNKRPSARSRIISENQTLPLSEVVMNLEKEYEKTIQQMRELKRQFEKDFPVKIGFVSYALQLKMVKGECHGLFWRRYKFHKFPAVYDDPGAYARDITGTEIQKAGFQEKMPVAIGRGTERSYSPALTARRRKGYFEWLGNLKKSLPPGLFTEKVALRKEHRDKYLFYNAEVCLLNRKREKLVAMRLQIKRIGLSLINNKLFQR